MTLVLIGLVGGIITGLSPCVLTLFGTLILGALHLPGDAIRWLGLALLVLVGLALLVPPLGHLVERPFYRFPQRALGTSHNGFLLGIALAFHASDVYLDVGGTGTLTVSAGGTTKTMAVSGAPDIYTIATEQPAQNGTVTIKLSPGLAAYSFTFG